MKILFKNLILVTLILSLFSCENEEDKLNKIEEMCSKKTSIEGFNISFFGYFPTDADSINIKIKRNGDIILNYDDKIPNEIYDSIRHERKYFVKNEIKLDDTVFIKIKNEPSKEVSDFKYIVRPHFSMLNRNWGCDFYELKINGEVSEGAFVDFTKKGWNLIEKEYFKNYYQEK